MFYIEKRRLIKSLSRELIRWLIMQNAGFLMTRLIFYSQSLTKNSQFENLENFTKERHSFLGF